MKRFTFQNPILVSFLVVLLLFISNCLASSQNVDVNKDSGSEYDRVPVQVPVGLVLDLGSVEGKIVRSSLSLALSDFYTVHRDYKTRLSLSVRNSHGEPLLSLASGVDLLQTVGVEAIIIAGSSFLETKLLAELGEKARVPVVSLNSPISSSLSRYSHLIQATHDSSSEAKGITAFIHEFGWNSVALVYEDEDDWRESMQLMVDHFHENEVRIRSKLGMMGEGFAWILTAKTMNSFHGSNGDDFSREVMEGVVGFKSYIPKSKELQNFTSRWRKSLHRDEVVGLEINRLSIAGVWAHDIAWALARAVEVTRMVNVSENL